jgi:phosphoribosylanthranilate isomerase (EC 5.3.1.24)
MYVKVCGITKPEQAQAIADLEVDALGFICVPQSKRYISPQLLRTLSQSLPNTADRIAVFVNADLSFIVDIWQNCHLTGVQLHGQETPELCRQLRQALPTARLIKAIAIKSPADIELALSYSPVADVLLLDAYDPQMAGGTGKTIDWSILHNFRSALTELEWWLAGGLHAGNVAQAIAAVQPKGVDVSSGVENSPGDKDIYKIKQFLEALRNIQGQ